MRYVVVVAIGSTLLAGAALGAASITSVSPATISVGASLDVKGSGFEDSANPKPPTAWLSFTPSGAAKAKKISLKIEKTPAASASEFVATLSRLPKGANGDMTLNVLPHGGKSADVASASGVFVALPSITTIFPASGASTGLVELTVIGTYFGSKSGKVVFTQTQGARTLRISGKLKSWSDAHGARGASTAHVYVPTGLSPGAVQVTVVDSAGASSPKTFTVQP